MDGWKLVPLSCVRGILCDGSMNEAGDRINAGARTAPRERRFVI